MPDFHLFAHAIHFTYLFIFEGCSYLFNILNILLIIESYLKNVQQ